MSILSGLSNLNSEAFTIINQIPTSQDNATKIGWVKHTLENCGKKDGLYDKSTGQMFYRANTWTAFLNDWQNYRKPLWVQGGYYTLSNADKEKYFTANVGDLIVFGEISEDAPTTIQEFATLCAKYKDCGGVITGAEAYISFKPNGKPWKTNHIEVIKG